MADRIFVKPSRPGLKVPFLGGFMPEDGLEVARDVYIARRLADGNLVEVEIKPTAAVAGRGRTHRSRSRT